MLLLKFSSAQSHRLALLLPILIAIIGYLGMDRPTAIFSGLLAASEISLLVLVLNFKK